MDEIILQMNENIEYLNNVILLLVLTNLVVFLLLVWEWSKEKKFNSTEKTDTKKYRI